MFRVLLITVTLVLIVSAFKFAYLASISSTNYSNLLVTAELGPARPPGEQHSIVTQISTTPQEPGRATTMTSVIATTTTSIGAPNQVTPPAAPTTSKPQPEDPNEDPDDDGGATAPPSNNDLPNMPNTTQTTTPPPNKLDPPDKTTPNNNNANNANNIQNKPQLNRSQSSTELSVLFYSVFIVYVSFVKLIYHNIHFIKHNLTEQGILMIFGIIWQLVARQISSDQANFPRFNSRIFFYLFLPSTVLESASLLSNKWLFFNLLPILTHSIIGTVLYASSMGFTIFALGRSEIFTLNWIGPQPQISSSATTNSEVTSATLISDPTGHGGGGSRYLAGAQLATMTDENLQQHQHDFSNLTLADCLIFGTILSSIDSAPMLNVFKQYQVNEKLYYLVLGENLMNQAVVITIFNLLFDFIETTRLTVVKIYIATLQFFANLIGAVLIGFALALFALISVRLTKRFQVPHALSSYHNQCQAMVETLLILKLAYLTYTLANLAGTSSILGLATFGILNDQYIKHNLNLRSQLAFRQVILGMKTMGYTLVYPLLGMLLVDTALSSGQTPGLSFQVATTMTGGGGRQRVGLDSPILIASTGQTTEFEFERTAIDGRDSSMVSAASVASKKLSNLANQAGLHWNFKFLSIVIVLTVLYRFLIVIALGLIGNVLTCGQLKIKFKEQILMAYGGFKGPLSIALVHSLMEIDEHKERIARNKHLFKYTVLINIFISAVLAGTFIRPLVARVQTTLIGRVSTSLGDSTSSTIVFEQINYKLTEYVSHGLNSILGHTRTPYDKFIEFNETHIKPWLVRGGSNTNWLSVFYNNLILDETLNANCFYIATEDPTTMRVFRSEQGKLKLSTSFTGEGGEPGAKRASHQSNLRSWLRRRTSASVSVLNTINENGGPLVMVPSSLSPRHWSDDTRQSSNVSRKSHSKAAAHVTGSMPSGELVAATSDGRGIISSAIPKDHGALKEFVMFNLKLESARRRRQRKSMLMSQQRQKQEQLRQHHHHHSRQQLQQQQLQQQHKQRPLPPKRFVIEDSSSSNPEHDSSLDRASRQVHLNQMEANLNGFEAPRAAVISTVANQTHAPFNHTNADRATATTTTFDHDPEPSSSTLRPGVNASGGLEMGPKQQATSRQGPRQEVRRSRVPRSRHRHHHD